MQRLVGVEERAQRQVALVTAISQDCIKENLELVAVRFERHGRLS